MPGKWVLILLETTAFCRKENNDAVNVAVEMIQLILYSLLSLLLPLPVLLSAHCWLCSPA